MVIISQQENWFSSIQGEQYFANIYNKEDQIGFIYSYLLEICKNNQAKYTQTILFKIAFLLSDAVLSSGFSYSHLPDFLQSEKNPYLAFVKNSNSLEKEVDVYTYLLLITHEKVNPFIKSEWIYEGKSLREYAKKIADIEHCILPSANPAVNPILFQVPKEKEFIQLEIIWLFGQSLM